MVGPSEYSRAEAEHSRRFQLPLACSSVTIEGMTLIQAIRAKVLSGAFEFSQHAVDQTILRHISVHEIREAINVGQVIEDYPNDKYGPSCLILGFTQAGRPIHVQCSYASRLLVKVITTYQPDPNEWVEYKQRRK